MSSPVNDNFQITALILKIAFIYKIYLILNGFWAEIYNYKYFLFCDI